MKISIDKIERATNGTMFTLERISFLLACIVVPLAVIVFGSLLFE